MVKHLVSAHFVGVTTFDCWQKWEKGAVRAVVLSFILSLSFGLVACSANVQDAQSPDLPQSRELGHPRPIALSDLNKWRNDEIFVSGDVSFESGSAQLTPDGLKILESVIPDLIRSSGDIWVEGYADGVGGFSEENRVLSEERAKVVTEQLQKSVPQLSSRIQEPKGHGAGDEVGGIIAIEGKSDPLRRVVRISVR